MLRINIVCDQNLTQYQGILSIEFINLQVEIGQNYYT